MLRLFSLHCQPESSEGELDLPEYDNAGLGWLSAVYEIDTLDNHNIPHRGTRLVAQWLSSLDTLGAEHEYDKASVSYRTARTFGGRHTLMLGLAGGATIDEDAPYYDQFMLGGLFRMSGLSDNQLVGQNAASGALLYYAKMSKSIYLGCGVETGNVWNDRDDANFGDLIWGGDVFVAVDTFGIGKTTPVYQKQNTAAAGGETIKIQDTAPTIDPTSTTQGITIDKNYIKNIPVPGRTFESALGAAAGSQGDGVGISFSGSSSLENQYYVDGVNTTGLTYGTVGSPVINDFIEEMEVSPADTTPSTAARPVASSTSSPNPAPTSSRARCSATGSPAC